MHLDAVLHVGYQKTATTWLQKVVLKRHPELALVTRRTAGSDWMQELIGEHPFAFDADRIRCACARDLAQAAGRLAFLSHEAWIGDPYTGGRNTPEIARRLKAVFPEARVVIVVREPLDMIESMYRQYVQEGGTLDCESLLAARFPARTRFDPHFLDYDEVLDLYTDLFGRDRVCALAYEELRRSPPAFLSDLLDFCGVGPLDIRGLEDKRKNQGLSRPSLRVARVLNRTLQSAFNPASLWPARLATARDLRRFLTRRVDRWLAAPERKRGDSPLLSSATRERLRDHYRPHVERLEREYGVAFHKCDAPEDSREGQAANAG